MQAVASVALALVAATAIPCAAAGRFYIGAAVGATRESSDYAEQVRGARTSDPAPPTDIRLDTDNRAAGRVFAGMTLSPSFALELDYADLGRLSSHSMWHGVEPFFQFERFGTIDVRAAGLSVVASAPVSPAFEVFGRAGGAYTWVDYSTVGTAFIRHSDGTSTAFPSPTPPDLKGDGWRGVVALGAAYRLSDRWSIRGEWARYFGVGEDYARLGERAKFDLDLASIGFSYRF